MKRPWCAAWLAALVMGCAAAHASTTDPASALRSRYLALGEQLEHNPFQRPIVLESTQGSGDVKGEVFAVVEHSFANVDAALKGATRWCEILMLHLNVKDCRAPDASATSSLSLVVGKKFDQPAADAYRLDFSYRIATQASDYLQILMDAEKGPLGTRDYRIALEAMPLAGGRSFIHLSYAYGFGWAARLAMQGYLSTIGSGKVGFSVVDRLPDGRPVYVGNMRGVIERNTMRYYLAIDAYLGSLPLPPQERIERRLRDWYAATERYPRQLHEMERDDYLAMKRRELQRQQAETQGLARAP